MIKKISIKNVASYGDRQQDFSPLKKINFLYGSNGTGKTTISKLIDDLDREGFEDCDVVWENNAELETLVYNREFVENNFVRPKELEGIFTLGEENKKVLEDINSKRTELAEIGNRIIGQRKNLEDCENKRDKLDDDFTETCWKLKQRFQGQFKEAFRGFMRKHLFRKRLLLESKANYPPPKRSRRESLKELESRAKEVFCDTPTTEGLIKLPDSTSLLSHEANPILRTVVIGKSDVDIAALIDRLGSSDWVKRGREFYYPDSEDRICPFCQQETPPSLETNLNDYFNEEFQRASEAIEKLDDSYKSNAVRIKNDLIIILNNPPDRLDKDQLQVQYDNLDSKITSNFQLIEQKRNEPSRRVKLNSLRTVLTDITKLLEAANSRINAHNRIVANISVEKKQLTNQVWKYLHQYENKDAVDAYNDEKKRITKGIETLEALIKDSNDERTKIEGEIRVLEKSTSSIRPTITAINELLHKFDFQGFSLAQSDRDNRYYKIQRPDGSDAKRTLSEGESSFITFLYFYQLVQGSTTESGVTTDRIVVFDDPVSSLDNEVLFFVSSLIKNIFRGVRDKDRLDKVKQVFVFTHNVYFHKEITFNRRRANTRRAFKDETFWLVRRTDRGSEIQSYKTNPIRTTYELLWREVQRGNETCVSFANTLRRILEYYFKILGGIDPDKICSEFEGEDKCTCRSFVLMGECRLSFPFGRDRFRTGTPYDPDVFEGIQADICRNESGGSLRDDDERCGSIRTSTYRSRFR